MVKTDNYCEKFFNIVNLRWFHLCYTNTRVGVYFTPVHDALNLFFYTASRIYKEYFSHFLFQDQKSISDI